MVNERNPQAKRQKPCRRGRLFVLFLRQIKASLGRYLSIVVITALGVAFFSGLRSIGSDMRLTAQTYMQNARFMDVRLLSTGGFTDDDLEVVRGVSGVSEAIPAYSGEALAQLSDKALAVRFHSLPENGEEMNLLTLLEGRMPQKSGECVMDPYFMGKSSLSVGDTVQFATGGDDALSDMLKTDRFTIVGVVQSPLYISFDRGASTVGSGETDAYCFVLFEDFSYSAYTELNLALAGSDAIDRYSSGYDELLSPVEDALEKAGVARSQIRYEEIYAEGREKLDDAKKEVADAERELADAAQKLKDARAELDSGWADYLEGIETFNDQIKSGKSALKKARAQYEEGLAEYEKGLAEYESGKSDAQAQLSEAAAKLKAGREEYEAGLAQYAQADQYCAALEGALSAGDSPQTAAAIGALAPSAQAIDAGLYAALSYYAQSPSAESFSAASQAVSGFRAGLTESKKALDDSAAKLASGEDQLAAARAETKAQLSEAQAKLTDAKAKLDTAAQEIEKNEARLSRAERNGQNELDEAKQKLVDGEAEYADGNAEYLEKKAEAEPELEDARQEIADGEQTLADLKLPEWYVLSQDENLGFNSFEQDTERMDALSKVIPVVFFLVVALVVMTSMTRLVDSDRSHIGTLKSLGYTRASIAANYLFYAVSASLFGCAAGAAFGPDLFPRIVFNAYTVMYTLPPLLVQYDPVLMVLSVLVAVLSAALPAWLVCLRSLKSTPAELIRPQAPRPGKRILLERIGFVWKRVSFSEKVSMRNLFRYKKRLLMTVFGVAACTALMFTGFSINDAITLVIPKQFEQLQTYDLKLSLKKSLTEEQQAGIDSALAAEKDVSLRTTLSQKNMEVTENGSTVTAVLNVPFEQDAFSEFITLRERVSKQALTFDDSGVIVTEKLADILDVSVGDTFTAADGDGNRFSFTVSGIAENYIAHYIYLTPALYEKTFAEPPVKNTILCNLSSKDGAEAICERLLAVDGVSAVSLTNLARGNMQKVMTALSVIVLVLIFSAAALVFVVLFSLNTINLEERARELATLKVLGFYNSELAAYIYRENVWLTLLGIAAGLLMGVGLQRYVLMTTEVNLLMFSRDILPQSYLYSAVLTLVFAMLVNLFMLSHFKKIDMVSSLKSVE